MVGLATAGLCRPAGPEALGRTSDQRGASTRGSGGGARPVSLDESETRSCVSLYPLGRDGPSNCLMNLAPMFGMALVRHPRLAPLRLSSATASP